MRGANITVQDETAAVKEKREIEGGEREVTEVMAEVEINEDDVS